MSRSWITRRSSQSSGGAKTSPAPPAVSSAVTFQCAGAHFIAIDSPVKHAFTFTPSVSLFIDCKSAAQLDTLFEKLSGGGEVLMPLDDYGFSKKLAWINDKYGVSWQLNLPAD